MKWMFIIAGIGILGYAVYGGFIKSEQIKEQLQKAYNSVSQGLQVLNLGEQYRGLQTQMIGKMETVTRVINGGGGITEQAKVTSQAVSQGISQITSQVTPQQISGYSVYEVGGKKYMAVNQTCISPSSLNPFERALGFAMTQNPSYLFGGLFG